MGDSYSVLILIFVKEVWLAHRIVHNGDDLLRYCLPTVGTFAGTGDILVAFYV